MPIHFENIDDIYLRIQERAKIIVAKYPTPSFYSIHKDEIRFSTRFFQTNPVILKIRRLTEEDLRGAMGHGRKHAAKVTVDAGALILIEGKKAGYSDNDLQKRLLLAQCAGMLHDVKRKKDDHALRGAVHARKLLKQFAFSANEIEDVACAIRNHEAFKPPAAINTPEGALLSGCLYDADKFRWGPDNFSDTVWDMVRYFKSPLDKFLQLYPRGLELLEKIRNTFRTPTGKKYGPEIIDLGLDIGKEVFKMIHVEFYLHR